MTSTASNKVRWTLTDLEGFPDNGNRYEIIDGDLFVTRAPHFDHQNIAGRILVALSLWSQQSGLGQAVMAPGVIFSESDAVIPDLIWVRNERLSQVLDDSGHLTAAPELVVEVLSGSTQDQKRDRETKLKLYSAYGVLEYWIVDREQKMIEVYRRDNGQLQRVLSLYANDVLTSPLLPDFQCSVGSIFEF
jgi:Uma2 family endonuclease